MNSRERFGDSGNLVTNPPDRPSVIDVTKTIDTNGDRIIVRYRKPLFVARVVRDRTIGGGTSKEAIGRAKRNLAGRYHIPQVRAWMGNTSWAEWVQRNNGH